METILFEVALAKNYNIKNYKTYFVSRGLPQDMYTRTFQR